MAETAPSSNAASTAPSDKIVLHWLENSRAQRVIWLLEELGVDYEIKPYKRVKMLAPPEMKEIHPLGKAPIITIGKTTIAESGFIFEYLIDNYNQNADLKPSTPEGVLAHKYFLHFAEGSLMPPLIVGFVISNIRNAAVPFFIKPITNAIANRVHENYLNNTYETNFTFLEKTLEDNEKGGFFVGDKLSGADIILSFPLDAAAGRVQGFTKEKYPRIFAWMERMKERDAYKRATEKTKSIEGDML